jgi:hypothetical protein
MLQINSVCVKGETGIQGVKKRCRLSWLTNSALVCEPKCGGGGFAVAGSQPMSTCRCAHGAQINFGDPPYLTYAGMEPGMFTLKKSAVFVKLNKSFWQKHFNKKS